MGTPVPSLPQALLRTCLPNRPPAATFCTVLRRPPSTATTTTTCYHDHDCDRDRDRARRPQLCPRVRPQSESQSIAPHGGLSTSQYSLMALTLQPRRPGYAFPRRIMHDIVGRTGNEANATLLPCASNATDHFPACCSSCHLRRCHSSRLISSHLVSFDSLPFYSAHIYTQKRTQCLSTRSLPASFHSQGRRA